MYFSACFWRGGRVERNSSKMSVRILSVFDTPDTADLALMHLRQQGISLSGVKQSYLGSMRREGGVCTVVQGTYTASAQIYAEAPGVMPVYPVDGVGLLATGGVANDALSGDVALEFSVDSPNAARAASILVSSHGRKIKRMLN